MIPETIEEQNEEGNVAFEMGESKVNTTQIMLFCAILLVIIVIILVAVFLIRKLRSEGGDLQDFDNIIEIAPSEANRGQDAEMTDLKGIHVRASSNSSSVVR